jgi:PAS domain-containing protein
LTWRQFYDNVAGVMGEGSAASNALVQSTLLGELLEHANVGVLAADSGRYIAANEYACEVIGYDRSELIGKLADGLCSQSGSGVFALRCKDGEVQVAYRSTIATLSGIPVVLSLFWPA